MRELFYSLIGLLFILSPTTVMGQGFTPAQQQSRDSIVQLNLIDRSYEFIDANFELATDQIQSDAPIVLKKQLARKLAYKDSLYAVLKYNLKNDYASYVAYHRILKKWQNIGFYLWLDPDEAEDLACDFNIDHPHRFYKFLVDESSTPQKEIIFERLKQALQKADIPPISDDATFKEKMYYAFQLNPAKIKAQADYMRKHSPHKH